MELTKSSPAAVHAWPRFHTSLGGGRGERTNKRKFRGEGLEQEKKTELGVAGIIRGGLEGAGR